MPPAGIGKVKFIVQRASPYSLQAAHQSRYTCGSSPQWPPEGALEVQLRSNGQLLWLFPKGSAR
eukprot:3619612-Amphidinium_carterae.2